MGDSQQKLISTSNLYMPDLDRVCEYLDASLDQSGQVARHAIVQMLETRLATYHQSPFCVAFSTGFWALVAAVQIKAIDDRPEVIIPSMTYRRLADVVHWAGKTPLIVDNDLNSLAMSCDAVANALSDRSSMILAVHPIVNCCDVECLLSISHESGVPIVFDAVESVHETVGGSRIGSFGVGEVFSLHASKLINGLEGGYVCTSDPSFRDQLMQFRSSQLPDARQGLNVGLCEAHAAFALACLDEIELNVRHNREVYRAYQRKLSEVGGVQLVEFDEAQQTSFKNIVVSLAKECVAFRDQLVQHLNDQGILARQHYYPALHAKTYPFPVQREPTPQAHRAMRGLINLPCGHLVTDDDVRRTCGAIDAFLTEKTTSRVA